jgi:L-ascorbate metabolism protein UlaG (beta-lactamase superfamily)
MKSHISRSFIIIFSLLFLWVSNLLVCCTPQQKKAESAQNEPEVIHTEPGDLVDDIHWYGNAAIRIETGDKTIFIDPFEIPESFTSDLVLITHPHFDHLSEPDLKKVATKDTVFVTPHNRQCINAIKKLFDKDPVVLWPGEQTIAAGFKVKAVPSYNVVKKERHPKEFAYLGYIITVDDFRIYHAGDTELIPEMKSFSCDIALLPLATIAIPIHYGSYEGTLADAHKFKELLQPKVRVIIKTKE